MNMIEIGIATFRRTICEAGEDLTVNRGVTVKANLPVLPE